jgi:hypothetical protein
MAARKAVTARITMAAACEAVAAAVDPAGEMAAPERAAAEMAAAAPEAPSAATAEVAAPAMTAAAMTAVLGIGCRGGGERQGRRRNQEPSHHLTTVLWSAAGREWAVAPGAPSPLAFVEGSRAAAGSDRARLLGARTFTR